jgi:hypothetical protein
MTCPECGSPDVVRGVVIGGTGDAGQISLAYRNEGILGIPLAVKVPLVADVCNACGVVVRLYVESVGKTWVQRKSPA